MLSRTLGVTKHSRLPAAFWCFPAGLRVWYFQFQRLSYCPMASGDDFHDKPAFTPPRAVRARMESSPRSRSVSTTLSWSPDLGTPVRTPPAKNMCLDTPHAPKKVRKFRVPKSVGFLSASSLWKSTTWKPSDFLRRKKSSLVKTMWCASKYNLRVANKLADMVKDESYMNCLRKEWLDMREHYAMSMDGVGCPSWAQFTRAAAVHSLS